MPMTPPRERAGHTASSTPPPPPSYIVEGTQLAYLPGMASAPSPGRGGTHRVALDTGNAIRMVSISALPGLTISGK